MQKRDNHIFSPPGFHPEREENLEEGLLPCMQSGRTVTGVSLVLANPCSNPGLVVVHGNQALQNSLMEGEKKPKSICSLDFKMIYEWRQQESRASPPLFRPYTEY